MNNEVKADAAGRPYHWLAGGRIIAGPKSAKEAQAMLDELERQAEEPRAPVAATDVRFEAERRMRALLGARDAQHLQVIISNGSREAVRLIRKDAAEWTAAEAVRAGELERVDLAIEALRAASNRLEAALPADYVDDRHWPAF